jgi:hypothetical protein
VLPSIVIAPAVTVTRMVEVLFMISLPVIDNDADLSVNAPLARI